MRRRNSEGWLDRGTIGDVTRISAHGNWSIDTAARLEREVDDAPTGAGERAFLDLSDVRYIDTAGAWLIHRLEDTLAAAGTKVDLVGVSGNARRLLVAVAEADRPVPPEPPRPFALVRLMELLGRSTANAGGDFLQAMSILGGVIRGLGRAVLDPSRFRITSIIYHLDRTGLQAVPIIFLISLLIGGIIAQQGVFQLKYFGADIFVVDLVGILVLREIAVLLTAIMLAGRSGSAYTAEIGSMKMREELDALKVIGLDPNEVLIMPRLVALVIALPLLTFISDIAGLIGGAIVAFIYGNITPQSFVLLLRDAVDMSTLMVGTDQGAVHGSHCRPGCGDRGIERGGQHRLARPADDVLGRQGDFHGHSRRRPLCDLLRGDRLLSMAQHATRERVNGNGIRRGDVMIRVRGLTSGFAGGNVLEGLDLDVYRGEILGVVGASGTGKTVLLRTVLGLVPKRAGSIEILGINLETATLAEREAIDRRLGVMFQQGALFSSLNVLQNVQVPMREHLRMSQRLMDELARLKIELVGLPLDAADKFPSELSGGMTKRAGLARALALDPEIVFLDEPTSGLDPIGAAEFDELIGTLRDTLGLTVFMVTHDLDSLHTVCDRIAVLAEKRVLVDGSLADMLVFDHPWVRSYFRGVRARGLRA